MSLIMPSGNSKKSWTRQANFDGQPVEGKEEFDPLYDAAKKTLGDMGGNISTEIAEVGKEVKEDGKCDCKEALDKVESALDVAKEEVAKAKGDAPVEVDSTVEEISSDKSNAVEEEADEVEVEIEDDDTTPKDEIVVESEDEEKEECKDECKDKECKEECEDEDKKDKKENPFEKKDKKENPFESKAFNVDGFYKLSSVSKETANKVYDYWVKLGLPKDYCKLMVANPDKK